ncbi:YchJ family protein [Saccharospirillum mangrovi]|uniref:YchJ family protein n=1 Tax=Saccharospirillum mangrovi TaxID=2161747 RepID=UPI000D3A8E6C|nr:YchJ family metal-binding protein [Saccharospirillum mangrovi]
MSACPCGRPADYLQCCGRYLEQGATVPDCETLMRSRYTAFVRKDLNYLLNSWHPTTRPDLQAGDLEGTVWLGLEVLRAKTGFKKGFVEFRARYRDDNGVEQELHDISRFAQHKKRWVYQDDVEAWPEG